MCYSAEKLINQILISPYGSRIVAHRPTDTSAKQFGWPDVAANSGYVNTPVIGCAQSTCIQRALMDYVPHTWCRDFQQMVYETIPCLLLNTLRLRRNSFAFADDIFKCNFLNENIWISLKISLKFVPNVRINNIPALVQIMAWRRPGDKPSSEPMLISLLTHTCVTRPQWISKLRYDVMLAFRWILEWMGLE